jgi:hypothetical protein
LWFVWGCFFFGPDGLVFCKLLTPGCLFLKVREVFSYILLNWCQCLQFVSFLILLHPWFIGWSFHGVPHALHFPFIFS